MARAIRPDSGARFARMLGDLAAPLGHLHYAILAMGDSSYTNYCGFGRYLDAHLRERRLQPLFGTGGGGPQRPGGHRGMAASPQPPGLTPATRPTGALRPTPNGASPNACCSTRAAPVLLFIASHWRG
ncbi:flavodoxin domain-containing protein [Massilia sp. B-10]|nr:flavodoxin domain-containing protein [Massilia sp. B-10]